MCCLKFSHRHANMPASGLCKAIAHECEWLFCLKKLPWKPGHIICRTGYIECALPQLGMTPQVNWKKRRKCINDITT